MCKLASKIVTVLQFTRAIRKIKEDKAKLRLYLDISLLYITCISFIIIISIKGVHKLMGQKTKESFFTKDKTFYRTLFPLLITVALQNIVA